MTAAKYGDRPMEGPLARRDELDAEEPFVTLRQALDTLPFFQKYAVLKQALAPVVQAKLGELAQADFDGQIRARVAYINRHVDKLYFLLRRDVVLEILPQILTAAEQVVDCINKSRLLETPLGRRLAMLIGTSLITELISALPDTMRDGNQHLIRNVTDAMEASWGVK